MKDNPQQSNDMKERLMSMVLVSPDLAYTILIKLLIAYTTEVLTSSATTYETYNIKQMSEILLNIGESLKISNSINTDETRQFIQQLTAKIENKKLGDELIKMASRFNI